MKHFDVFEEPWNLNRKQYIVLIFRRYTTNYGPIRYPQVDFVN
jgi:hypothetical protein